MNDAAVSQDTWDYYAQVQRDEEARQRESERAEAYGRYIAPAGAPKISGLPTNHYDPSTAALPYQQGAFNYNNHWGTPEWYGGQIIGYSFVQHDVQPGYKSYFRTDLEGNVVHHEISPEGEDLTFKDILKMAAPFVLSFIPGVGAAIGGALAPTVSTATQAVIGNALVQGTLAEATGGDFIKGALTSVASSSINTYAGDVGSSMGITDPAIAKVVGKTLLQGTFTAATGGDFIDGAITGALSGTGQKAGEYVGLEGAAASSVGTSVVNGVIASVKGKDVSDAMINGAISGFLGYKEPKEVAAVKSEQQTVPTQEEMQPSINQLTKELAPYEQPSITVPTQEEMQLSIDDLTKALAPYEQPNVPKIVEETDKEPVDATEREGSLAKETEPTQTPIDLDKIKSIAGTIITGAGIYNTVSPSTKAPSITTPSTTITRPSTSTPATTPSVTDEDIYKDAPVKGFSMRQTASGKYVPYIGEKAQLATGGFISKKTRKTGLASRK